jgi:DNA-binding transcriptional LysR family regulator
LDRIQAMRVLVRIADSGSFAGAARTLNMSPPAVSRAVGMLEDHVGARLLTRTTRSLRMTEVGARYVEDCRHILSAIDEAEAAAAGSYARPTGNLAITASVMFGQIYVLPLVTRFLDLYPEVGARLLFLDRVTNLVDEGIDVAIRIGHLPDSSHSAVRVGSVRQVVCGAPEYFARAGVPQVPADLASHRIIGATSAYASTDWTFGRNMRVTVRVKPALLCNSNPAVIAAAKTGWGITRILSYQVGAELADGSLVTALDDFEESPLPVHIVHPEGRNASAKVRLFVDFATEALRANRFIN